MSLTEQNVGSQYVEASLQTIVKIAAKHAVDVDKNGRFPREVFDLLKEFRFLSLNVPSCYGGLEATTEQTAHVCSTIAEHCASSAMILAMHCLQIITLVKHHEQQPFLTSFFRQVSDKQLLLASATSEIGTGGNLGMSLAPITGESHFSLKKHSPAISYGNEADAILITARSSANAAVSDQRFILLEKNQYQLVKAGEWDAIGLRGTCSPPFTLSAEFSEQQIIQYSARKMANNTLTAISHILWAAVWQGIARAAVNAADSLIKSDIKQDETLAECHLGLNSLVQCQLKLQMMTSLSSQALSRYKQATFSVQDSAFYNNLKVASSELVLEICLKAMNICGFRGLSNQSELGVSRCLRDALSAPVMISNARLMNINTSLALL